VQSQKNSNPAKHGGKLTTFQTNLKMTVHTLDNLCLPVPYGSDCLCNMAVRPSH